jgi:hypothetical protein
MTCPQCGAPMEIDRCCVIEERVYRHLRRDGTDTSARSTRLAAAALCTGCECCIELAQGTDAYASTSK